MFISFSVSSKLLTISSHIFLSLGMADNTSALSVILFQSIRLLPFLISVQKACLLSVLLSGNIVSIRRVKNSQKLEIS
jgi:hypothetical protein